MAGVHRQLPERKELHSERTLETFGGLSLGIQLRTLNAHAVHVKKLPEAREKAT